MIEFLNLLVLIIFRYEAGIIYLHSAGYSLMGTFLILTLGMLFTSLSIYWLTGRKFLQRKFHFPRFLIIWLQEKLIYKSFISYRNYLREKNQQRISRVIKITIKLFEAIGYTGLALAAMVPLPLFRTGSVIAVRIGGLKNGIYVVIGAVELKLLFEILLYYRLKIMIPFARDISSFQISLFFIGGFILYFLIGWLNHAIRDNHFIKGRFD